MYGLPTVKVLVDVSLYLPISAGQMAVLLIDVVTEKSCSRSGRTLLTI